MAPNLIQHINKCIFFSAVSNPVDHYECFLVKSSLLLGREHRRDLHIGVYILPIMCQILSIGLFISPPNGSVRYQPVRFTEGPSRGHTHLCRGIFSIFYMLLFSQWKHITFRNRNKKLSSCRLWNNKFYDPKALGKIHMWIKGRKEHIHNFVLHLCLHLHLMFIKCKWNVYGVPGTVSPILHLHPHLPYLCI